MNSVIFSGIGFLKAHLIYRSRVAASHTRPPRTVAYALQELLKEELERLQKQQIIVPWAWMRHKNGAIALSWGLN